MRFEEPLPRLGSNLTSVRIGIRIEHSFVDPTVELGDGMHPNRPSGRVRARTEALRKNRRRLREFLGIINDDSGVAHLLDDFPAVVLLQVVGQRSTVNATINKP